MNKICAFCGKIIFENDIQVYENGNWYHYGWCFESRNNPLRIMGKKWDDKILNVMMNRVIK